MGTESIRIVVSETGSRIVQRNIEAIGEGAKKSENSVSLLKNALATIGIGIGVAELIQMVDTYTNLQNRLKLVTNSTQELSQVTKELFDIANATRVSYESTAELFSRTALAVKELGISSQQTLDFVKTLNQAVILSGASAQEAHNGIIQLTQGLALGTLRGQDLKSVMEELPGVAAAIAKGMGVTRGEFKRLADEGKITTQIIFDALKKVSGEVDTNFKKTVSTLGQSFVELKNHTIELVGKLDTANGISRTLANTINELAKNLDKVVEVVVVAGGVALLNFVTAIIATRTAMVAASIAATEQAIAFDLAATAAAGNARMVAAMATAQRAAAGAISTTTILVGSGGTAALAASGFFTKLGASLLVLGRGLVNLVGGPIGILLIGLYELTNYLGGVDKALLFLSAGFIKVGNTILSVFSAALSGIEAIAQRMYNVLFSLGEGLANFVAHPFADNNFSSLGEELDKGFVGAFKDAYAKVRKESDDFNKGIDQALYDSIQKIDKLKNPEKVDLDKPGKNQTKLEPNKDFLKEQKKILEDIDGPLRKYIDGQKILNALYADGKGRISLAQYNQELDKLETNLLNSTAKTTFAEGYTSQLRIMQLETRNAVADMGKEFATIFGPGGTLVKGIGDAVAQSIVFGKSFKESIGDISREILSKLISSLVQVGVNMLINFALGESLKAASTTTSVAAAATTAAAWSPAAAMTSLASFGSNSIGAIAGIGASIAAAASAAAAVVGFESGGYTGGGGKSQIAGVVHGQEFVMNAGATARNRTTLEAMNAGRKVSAEASGVNVNIINQAPGVEFETRQLGERDVEIIARRVVRQDAPGIIAGDLSNPNSKTSKSLSQNTDASRRRT